MVKNAHGLKTINNASVIDRGYYHVRKTLAHTATNKLSHYYVNINNGILLNKHL